VLRADEIPATLSGIADFNIANALAAIAVCAANGVSLVTIRNGLRDFTSSYEDSPGRLNIHDVGGVRVLLDYAHNPAGMAALGDLLDRMRGEYRRVIGMVSIPGDRRNEDIIDVGQTAARMFDEIVFREAPDARGRPRGEVNALMAQGALLAGLPPQKMRQIIEETAATEAVLQMSRPGDLVVVLASRVQQVWEQILAFEPEAIDGSSLTELASRKPAHA
jgi:cyanophycin synthetase